MHNINSYVHIFRPLRATTYPKYSTIKKKHKQKEARKTFDYKKITEVSTRYRNKGHSLTTVCVYVYVCVCIQSCLAGWQNHLRIHPKQKQFQFNKFQLILLFSFLFSFSFLFQFLFIFAYVRVCVCLLMLSKFCRFFNRYKTFRTSL